MIHVFFVPGMFGSTIEYLLRNFTEEYTGVEGKILADGSMHSFVKEFHPLKICDLNRYQYQDNTIATPQYPFQQAHLDEILNHYVKNATDHYILMYANDLKSAELNCLFQYHKIAFGAQDKKGLRIFCNGLNASAWNPNYGSWQDMKTWELREWFSIFYPTWVSEWINSKNLVDSNWLSIQNIDVLYNTKNTFSNIIDHCQLTTNKDLTDFANTWRQAQQYIIDEFNLLDQIINDTLSQKNSKWDTINIIAESIVQQRLRALGYEIRCHNLNTFPTDTETLYNLLEKI